MDPEQEAEGKQSAELDTAAVEGESTSSAVDALDGILGEVAGALENVRQVLVNAIENYPRFDSPGQLVIVVQNAEHPSTGARPLLDEGDD